LDISSDCFAAVKWPWAVFANSRFARGRLREADPKASRHTVL
jgi:hypothetical protein